MELSNHTFAWADETHLLITSVFVLGFLCTLFRTFSTKDGAKYQKLCGAIALFLIAMEVDEYYFYGLVVLFGGLIVASESFVLILASIGKASQGTIIKIVKEILRTSDHVSGQVKEKDEREIAVAVEQVPQLGPSEVPLKI